MKALPGLAVALAGAVVAWGVHLLVPAMPFLTAAVLVGAITAQIPTARRLLDGVLAPGLGVAAKSLLRAGIVLLGLRLSIPDIFELGWVTFVSTVVVVVLTFFGTWALGRLFKLPENQAILIASGFSICGASAVGAMAAAIGAKRREQALPVALVTLCGTLAIAILPVLWHPLGLSATQFGHWVGASVHDVGQVVATAQIAGPAALAVAIVVKLTRVLMLAPMVATTSLIVRRRAADAAGPRPAIVPVFIVGFVAAVLVATFVPVPPSVLAVAGIGQEWLLALALVALGSSIRVDELARTGGRALAVGLLSWVLVAVLAYGAVMLG